MSNKTLMLAIIAIVVVGAGAAAYFYWQNTKPLTVSPENLPVAENNITPTPVTTSTPMPTPTPTQVASQCQRNFDENKLKSATVSIVNRQVEINVKDFGKIDLELYDKDAPKAVENFLRLVNSGYYDCVTFHRVAKGFVIQGGDPKGDGTGGQSAFGKPFADELNADTASYKAGYVKGVLAMANSGANTNGSQFFIMLEDVPLPHAYTIFGKVFSGLDVVEKIGQVDITPVMGPTDGTPKTPVVMQSVKIIK